MFRHYISHVRHGYLTLAVVDTDSAQRPDITRYSHGEYLGHETPAREWIHARKASQ